MLDFVLAIGVSALLYLVYRTSHSEDNTTSIEKSEADRKPDSNSTDASSYRPRTAGDRLRDGRLSSLVEESPNGEYQVLATESATENSRDGTVAMAHAEDGVLWEKSLYRPNQPSVSNDGTVTVESWTPAESRDLSSGLFVFSKHGDELLNEEYDANALRSGITPDGKLVWFTTANADNEDGNQLFVYDVHQRKRLLKTELPMRGVEGVGVSEDVIEVTIDGLRCRYRNGEMLDSDNFRWAKEEQRLEHAQSPGNVAGVAKNRLERADELSDQQIRSTIEAARNFDGSGSDRTWAKFWRRKGELHQYLGEKEQALEEYEKALSLDENVGVKRKSRRLREDLDE
jgi:hypothetical protein